MKIGIVGGLIVLWGLQPLAQAAECDRSAAGSGPMSITLRVDNDLFGGRGQDEGYTNGTLLSVASPNLTDFEHDPCLPQLARSLNRYLGWMQPDGGEQRNMVFAFGQALFTPSDNRARHLLENDRPYAAALLFSLGYNVREGDTMRSNHLRLGIVGPSALGRQSQDAWHKLTDSARFYGWDNQLRDEPVFQFIHERAYRHALAVPARPSGWGQDVVARWGGALGNLATYANVGAEWRIGWGLPDDFGSSPLQPAGENTTPLRKLGVPSGWAGHVFVTASGRWVVHDISLDGNTFKNSHSVHRRPFVADMGYGVAITRGNWKLALARYHRTREFDGQRELPVFGSITLNLRM